MSEIHAADWETLPPLPEPNGGFIAGAFGENVVIAGGTSWRGETKHWHDTAWIFEPAKNAWREAARLAAPLAYAAHGTTRDGLWFAGGSSGPETHTTLSQLDPKFAMKTVATFAPRFVYASGAILDGKLYVLGGAEDQVRIETASNVCWAIDLASGRAARLADLPGPGRIVGAAAACSGRVFAFGGAAWDAAAATVRNLAEAFAFSPAENRWEKLPPLPTANRGLNAVALDAERIFLAGGYKNDVEEFSADAFIFHIGRGEYRPTRPLPHRAMVALVKAGDYLYCLGGEDKKKHRTDKCFRIRIADLRE